MKSRDGTVCTTLTPLICGGLPFCSHARRERALTARVAWRLATPPPAKMLAWPAMWFGKRFCLRSELLAAALVLGSCGTLNEATTPDPDFQGPTGTEPGDDGSNPGGSGGEGELEPGKERVADFRRVGRRNVQAGGITDSPARSHTYRSVAAFDDGTVVLLNAWQSPQLFEFHRSTNTLELKALHVPHERLGNEDDFRTKIRKHQGPTIEESFVLWSVGGYEESVAENDPVHRDTAVFSNRPIQQSPGRFPVRKARACNFVDSPNVGPGRSGVAYDPKARLLFAPIERGANPTRDDLFQVYRLNTETGDLEGRLQVFEPNEADTRENFSFISVSPEHQLVMLSASNYWQRDDDILYMARYTPTGGQDVANIEQLERLDALAVDSGGYMHGAVGSAFVESAGELYALLVGQIHDPRDNARRSSAIFVYSLGAVGGEFQLSHAVGVVPLSQPAESVQRLGADIVVSGRGLHVFDAEALTRVRGTAEIAPKYSYPLPYPTYEFDVASLDGTRYLFLAAGDRGVEIFRVDGNSQSVRQDPFVGVGRSVSLESGPGAELVSTGSGLDHVGAPALNAAGQVVFWAATDQQREVIVRRDRDGTLRTLANTGNGSYVSFGRPAITESGEVAVYAGSEDGSEHLLVFGADQATPAAKYTVVSATSPTIGDAGRLLYSERGSEGNTVLYSQDPGEERSEVARSSGSFDPFDARQPLTEYALGNRGDVFYFERDEHSDPTAAMRWNQGSQDTLFRVETMLGRLRAASNYLTFRAWSGEMGGVTDELSKLYRVSEDGHVVRIAEHRREYSGHRFANFEHSAANASGDVAFVGIRWNKDGYFDPDLMGPWLHLYRESSPDPSYVLLRPGTMLDGGGRVTDIGFVDGFNDGGAIVFSVTQGFANSGKTKQSILARGLD